MLTCGWDTQILREPQCIFDLFMTIEGHGFCSKSESRLEFQSEIFNLLFARPFHTYIRAVPFKRNSLLTTILLTGSNGPRTNPHYTSFDQKTVFSTVAKRRNGRRGRRRRVIGSQRSRWTGRNCAHTSQHRENSLHVINHPTVSLLAGKKSSRRTEQNRAPSLARHTKPRTLMSC